MRQVASILGSALFLVVAPGTIAGLVPWRVSRWRFGALLIDGRFFTGYSPLHAREAAFTPSSLWRCFW